MEIAWLRVDTHVRTAHASSDYASFEDFGLFAIDHFQKRVGNLVN